MSTTHRIFAPNYQGCAVLVDLTVTENPITFATKRFFNFTGYDATEVIGRNCRFLQGPKTDEKDVGTLRSAVRNLKPVELTILNYKKDETPFFNHLVLRPVRELGVRTRRFVGHQNPISETAAHFHALWNLSLDECLLAEALDRGFDLMDSAEMLGIFKREARTLFESLLIKTGTAFARHDNIFPQIGTARHNRLTYELREAFEQSVYLRSSVRPNGKPGELTDTEFSAFGMHWYRSNARIRQELCA